MLMGLIPVGTGIGTGTAFFCLFVPGRGVETIAGTVVRILAVIKAR